MTEFAPFVRKPFIVDAVQVTEENISILSALIGTLQREENGSRYIAVDRQKVPNVTKVTPGYWVTKMGNNIRCYSSSVFEAQFLEGTPSAQHLVNRILGVSNAEEEVSSA